MITTADEMRALVEKEIQPIHDPLVRDKLRSLLVTPVEQKRGWHPDGEPIYMCWLIMEHPASNTGIAYSEQGFGSESPWGLVFMMRS